MKDRNMRVCKQSYGVCVPFARMEKFMVPCLLFSLKGKRSHGYELMEKLKPFGFEGSSADMTTLYRTMRHLEEGGMVISSWEDGVQGPSKRVYELTKEGKTLLDNWVIAIKENRVRLDRFITLYEDQAKD